MLLAAILSYFVSQVKIVLRILPVFFVEADIGHAEQALELHAHSSQFLGNTDTLVELVLGFFHVTF